MTKKQSVINYWLNLSDQYDQYCEDLGADPVSARVIYDDIKKRFDKRMSFYNEFITKNSDVVDPAVWFYRLGVFKLDIQLCYELYKKIHNELFNAGTITEQLEELDLETPLETIFPR